jgi:hypothetical protein
MTPQTPSLDTRINAFVQAWADASVLKRRRAYDLAFYRFWDIACTAPTFRDETAALAAAFDCYERLRGHYIPAEFR